LGKCKDVGTGSKPALLKKESDGLYQLILCLKFRAESSGILGQLRRKTAPEKDGFRTRPYVGKAGI
jgi:hypothetical protein